MTDSLFIDPILEKELKTIQKAVTSKDRDYVMVIDGEEGSGKSVLAMQIAKRLDPSFNLKDIVFHSEPFIDRIKKCPKFSCILLDEAFNASNARASLTEVNRAMIAVASEMRQRNLFIIMVIPSFFDLDKYFALWRCRCLIHVYFSKDGGRGQYYIFPKTTKKYLYLNGKKFYDYSKPKSPYPVCRFREYYTVDEVEYREKKAEAFRKRTVSNLAKKWKGQRDALIKELYHTFKVATRDIALKINEWGERTLSEREIQRIVQIAGDVPSWDTDTAT